MAEIGKFNSLKVVKLVDFGLYLDGGSDGEILLPRREVPAEVHVGDELHVFIHFDSEDRLVATLQKPLVQVGEFALLEVVSVQSVGAFLNWGLSKDLFLPHAEQSRPLKIGQKMIVFVYIDKSSRISASMRLERNLEKSRAPYEAGADVELFLFGKTDLGYKAIVDGRYLGVLYGNEVFQELRYGQKLRGYIKKIREEDGKIDLTLQRPGHEAAQEDIGPLILKKLKENGGFLEINDKASAETIHDLFGVSKKKFKIALGGLYKKRLITVEEDGIRLV